MAALSSILIGTAIAATAAVATTALTKKPSSSAQTIAPVQQAEEIIDTSKEDAAEMTFQDTKKRKKQSTLLTQGEVTEEVGKKTLLG